MKNGAGTPYISVEDFEGNLIHERIVKFSYVFSEKTDDFSSIIFQFSDVNFPDHPGLQDNRFLFVQWGYREDPLAFNKRKVYIREAIPDYRQDSMTLELKCSDKASYIKNNKPNKTHSGNPIAITEQIAKENGLTLSTELYTSEQDTVKDSLEANEYENYPQAGVNDMRFLNDLWEEQEGGPYSVEGRDDELIVKRRNYGQKPKKSFTYNKEPYTLLSFRPETKNRRFWKKANKTTIEYWDAATQTLKTIEIDALKDNTTRLADVDVYSKDYFVSAVVNKERWDKLISEQVNLEGASHPDDIPNDPTSPGYEEKWLWGPDVLDQRDHTATLGPRIPQRRVNYLDMLGKMTEGLKDPAWSEKEALSKALSRRQSAASNINPGSAVCLGDPSIQCGIVLTFLGVSKKHSGNYYVTKVVHDITKDGGYTMEVSFVRNARNKVSNNGPGVSDISTKTKVNKVAGGYDVILPNKKKVRVSEDDVEDFKRRENTFILSTDDKYKNKEYDRYNNPFPEQ